MSSMGLWLRSMPSLCVRSVGRPSTAFLWTSGVGAGAATVRQWPRVVAMGSGIGGVRVGGCVAISGGHQWSRCMSYVSNARRVSGRYRQSVRLVAIGVAVGSAVLAVDSIYRRLSLKLGARRQLSSAAKIIAAEDVPQTNASRSVTGPTNLGMTFTLYQYQSCPFCCKVRAFMDYYGIPYNVVEVNPVMRQQLKFSKYRKVPILLIQKNGESEVLQINDSTTIVSALSSYLISRKPDSRHADKSLQSIAQWYHEKEVVKEDGVKADEIINRYFLMFGDIAKQKLDTIEGSVGEERNWRRWADDHFVHTLSPNIYRTVGESMQAFRHFSEIGEWDHNFKVWEKYLCIYLGSSVMYLIGKRLKKKHHLTDDVRESLYHSSRHWLKAIGKDRKFMGGNTPNLADLAVYGVLNSIEGCDAFTDLLEKTRIGLWYYSVQELVRNKAGVHELEYLKINE